MNDATPPAGELFVTQFLVVSDQDRSRHFYRSVFGTDYIGDIVRMGDMADGPDAPPLPEAEQRLVGHVELPILAGTS